MPLGFCKDAFSLLTLVKELLLSMMLKTQQQFEMRSFDLRDGVGDVHPTVKLSLPASSFVWQLVLSHDVAG